MADSAFTGAGQEPGLTLWRIESKQVKLQPEINGKFHVGDSYILLSTTQVGRRLEWKIHFWLGSETSQDESGIAAYKTVELDEALGGGPVQYREVQGYESSQFLSYFKGKGIEYLPGGVESGFAHVERDVYRTRLLHLKGKRVVRVTEVPCISSSLNTGDVFILDMGLKLYLYNGQNANKFEKAKGVEMILGIKDDERGGRAQIIFVHEDPNNAEFWGALGGKTAVTSEGEADEVVERVNAEALKLYVVHDEKVTTVDCPDGKLSRGMLDPGDVYILDAGRELYVWIGKTSSLEAKKNGTMYAANFVQETGRPNHTPIQRVVQGMETSAFKGYFSNWTTFVAPDFSSPRSRGIASVKQGEIDYQQLSFKMRSGESKRAGYTEADELAVDDGSGTLKIWVIDNFAKKEIDAAQYGQFYGGDSYILLYTYNSASGREEYIIYFWQGKDSSQDEKGASALLAKELDDEMGDRPVQVRVVQGKEPKHFRSIFNGRLIIHAGGRASGFKNKPDADSIDNDGIALFHVKGTKPMNTYGVQVPEKASSLNSGDCFVLVTPSVVYTWKGKHCSEEELAVASNIADMLMSHQGGSRTIEGVEEGAEPDAFWSALGGEGEYPETGPEEAIAQEPRLFQISNATGVLQVEEIENFDQQDLCNEDVMLLDTFTTVFVWLGGESNEMEKREAVKIAQAYVDTATDGRSEDTSIVRISAGNEPSMFTQHFRGWDPELLKKRAFIDPFEAKMAALKEQQAAKAAKQQDLPGTVTAANLKKAPEPKAAATISVASGQFVPYADLKGLGKIVDGVDPARREEFLSDKEFNEVFGMPKVSLGDDYSKVYHIHA